MFARREDWLYVHTNKTSELNVEQEPGCHLVLSYFTHGETEAQGGGATPPDPNGVSHVPSSFDLLHNPLVRKGGFMFIVLRNDPRRLVTSWE